MNPASNSPKKLRLTLVIASLQMGGAERVMALLANAWANRGDAVTLITLTSPEEDFFALDPSVQRVVIGWRKPSNHPLRAILNNGVRLWRLRHALAASQPNVVISFIDTMNVMAVLASRGLGLPIIVCERVNPEQHQIGSAWKLLRGFAYPRAAALVVQTSAVAEWGQGLLPPECIFVIPNPILPEDNHIRNNPGQRIVAVGRLVRQKGHDLLLRAFAQVAPDFPDWRLRIIGDGPEMAALVALTRELNIADRVEMPGRSGDIPGEMAQAGLFVLSSRFEGFPNALIEAMAASLPVIAADCPSGPREIVRHEVDGLLVPPENVDALAAAMRRLMSDPDERARLAARASEVRERFSMERVLALWDDAIQQTLARRR